jgi:hypothetical protein
MGQAQGTPEQIGKPQYDIYMMLLIPPALWLGVVGGAPLAIDGGIVDAQPSLVGMMWGVWPQVGLLAAIPTALCPSTTTAVGGQSRRHVLSGSLHMTTTSSY